MMRAALIVVGLSTLAIMEIETPPRTTKAAVEPLAQSTAVGMSDSRGTLTKTDRLEIPFLQHDAMAQPSSFRTDCSTGHDTHHSTTGTKIQLIGTSPDANEKQVVVVKPKPRPKHQESKKACKDGSAKGDYRDQDQVLSVKCLRWLA